MKIVQQASALNEKLKEAIKKLEEIEKYDFFWSFESHANPSSKWPTDSLVFKKKTYIFRQKTALKQENVRLKDENATLKEEISLLKQVINQSPCNDGKGYRYSGAPSFFGSTSSQARNSIVSSPLTDRTNSMTSGTPITMRRLSLLTPPVAGKMG